MGVFLDDGFFEHPKTVAAGGQAAWLFVCMLGYANRALFQGRTPGSALRLETAGRVPKNMIPRLTDLEDSESLAARLAVVKFCHDGGDFYEIHDYVGWNAAALERAERARRAAVTRWSSNARASAGHMLNGAGSNARANAQAMPVPVPVPEVQSQSPAFPDTSNGAANRPNRDREPKTGGRTPQADAARLIALCTARNRNTVQFEAVAVIAWAQTYVDHMIIDEAIGWFEQADEKPALPRAVAALIRRKAADHEIVMPEFATIGKTVE